MLIFLLPMLAAASQAATETPQPTAAEAAAAACTAHKLEIPVHVDVGGKMKTSTAKLCGEPGQTDSQWMGTLRDAVEKVRANEKMPQEVRDQIVTAIQTELAKLAVTTKTDEPAVETAAAPPAVAEAPPPEESPPAPAAAPPPAAAPVVAPATAAVAPRLDIRCYTPGDRGGARPCSDLEGATLLTVSAEAAVPAGARLRFLRRGDARGEIALQAMRKGQAVRLKLPSSVCSGVASSVVQIEVLGPGSSTPAETLGPLPLRC